MFIKTKIKIAQTKLQIKKTYAKILAQSKRIALATLITQYIIAISWYGLESHNMLQWLNPKVIIINNTQIVHAQPSTIASEAPTTLSDTSEYIADIIYKLESSNGINDAKCERIGKHNGYGYGQGNNKNYCLESDDEMRKVVIKWIKDKQSKGMNTTELLCYYNTGTVQSQCDYTKGISI